MNDNIKVSIITPSYNQGQFIEETICSVLDQTYKNIEYILIDGGSTDDTMKVVEKYKDRIDIIIHEKDRGQTDAINKGFRLATGELVGWINSDDLLFSDCVEEIVKLHNAKKDGVIYYPSRLSILDKKSAVSEVRTVLIDNRDYLLQHNYDLIQQGSFYKMQTIREINYLDEKIHYCMDLDLWLRLLNKGPIYHFDEKPLSGFRRWEDTKTATGGNKFLNDILKVLKREGMSLMSKNYRKIKIQQFKNKVKHILKY